MSRIKDEKMARKKMHAVINVGIIGVGGMAQRHAQGIIAQTEHFHLWAACDTNPSVLKKFGDKFGISKFYSDYRKMLEDSAIEAVFVLLPHHLHKEVCVSALERGKHVLVEKPIARTLKEADSIIKAARDAGVTLMVAHNQRYHPAYMKIRELLDSEAIGEVFCARIDHHQNFNSPTGHWWRSKEIVGGGCVIGSGIHRLDLLRWYLGEAEEVFAYEMEDPRRLEAEVACVAVVKFHTGAIAEFMCN